jgi:hypothetical protein
MNVGSCSAYISVLAGDDTGTVRGKAETSRKDPKLIEYRDLCWLPVEGY